MLIPLLFAAVATFSRQQEVPTAVFTEPYVGMQFNYPKTWTVVHSNKRKDKDRTTLMIPIDGSSEKGELNIDRTTFHASTDLWQTIQLRANEQLHRTVTRQWSQEVLGVSMLFSRIDYTDHGTAMASMIGLFYTRTNEKLLLRLTSPASDFDKVNIEFGRLLETLRQTDGKLPQEDNPNVDLTDITPKLEKAPIRPHSVDPTPKKTIAPIRAPVSVETVVSTRKVVLRVPLGWTAENIKENGFDLKTPELNGSIHFQVFSTLDSDAPNAALIKFCATDLDTFTKVGSREDSNPDLNKAGCTISTVWRVGKDANGDLTTCAAMGSMGEYYFLTMYRLNSVASVKAEKRILDALFKSISVEPLP